MRETYKQFIHAIWHGAKLVALASAILIPGIAFLAYMFATGMPDVGITPGILAVLAILLWSPIPLHLSVHRGKTITESYLELFAALGIVIVTTAVSILYLAWILLPFLAAVAFWLHTGHIPVPPGELLAGVLVNLAYGPAAHFLFIRLLDKLPN